MDFSFLINAYGVIAQAVLGAVTLALGIWLFPVVANAFLDMLHWPVEGRVKFPADLANLNWLRDPWVAIYTLAAIGAVITYFALLL